MSSPDRPPDGVRVAIIGGGFSGTALLAELTRRGVPAVLIEGGGRAGQGTAYATREPEHVLNVRAEVMSARADDAAHFARFVEAEGGTARDFVQRCQFGRYLTGQLDEARDGGGAVREALAVGAEPTDGGWIIRLSGGGQIAASALVLALGNQAPEPPDAFAAAGPRVVNNPWSDDARAAEQAAAASGEDVLLLGTGLTMVDTALSLDAAGHRGTIVALSRRGLIPRGHVDQPGPPAPVALADVPQGNVLGLWRWLKARTGSVDWRAAVDSLRPHSHALWQGFSEREQKRFMRHARPWWDVHRHRIAPEVARTIKRMIAEGRLEIAAGRVRQAVATDSGIAVTIARRGRTKAEVRSFGRVFNCTGPLGAIGGTRDPLLRQLLDDGLVRPDRLGIALEVNEDSRAAGAERLWALGPMTKGRFWEIIAVPDIRVQVAAVADDIAKELAA
jgi:uncharacterized NAD(P)/FAD-binding protein YdhS